MPIAASVVLHAPTKGGKTTVAKSVKLSKTKVSVNKGKSVNVKAEEVLEEAKLKLKTHRAVKVEVRNGWQTHAAKSVNDSRLDNPTPFWTSLGYSV